ncbi:PTS glucose transporter subunit IIA [Lactiplantibacillus herbarum]|uniref:PTS glucose transporter subunit IIA n=1 Tax=Lactiplantibacillus herbarum TaxID=1670446 RepID=UPI00064FEC2A|nr:PTS glucose transporter subunit IIA [Lactiplantibacillus herbarum]
MGLFGFGKKVKLYAPVDGTLTELAATQTGFAVESKRHHIFSPITGTVSELSPEDHTIKLTTGNITVHLQMVGDTEGTPAIYVHEGDQVTPGSPLAFVDPDQSQEDRVTVAVIVDNDGERERKINLSTSGQVRREQEVATTVDK